MMPKNPEKLILACVMIILVIFQISCSDEADENETVISKNNGNSDSLSQYDNLKAENNDFIAEVAILKTEILRLEDEKAIEAEKYQSEIDILHNQIIQLTDENEKIKSELDEYIQNSSQNFTVSDKVDQTENNNPENEISSEKTDQQIFQNVTQNQSQNVTGKTSENNTVEQSTILYVLNKNTKKFHLSTCSSASSIKSENYAETYSRDYAISNGYDACKKCNP